MPKGQQYTVEFPDGYKATFMAAPGMTDEQLITRAKQERDVSSGRIQTSFTGGALKKLGTDEQTTGALLNGVGMIPGLTPIGMLSAPLARGIKYGTEKMTGENPSVPDSAEAAGLAAKTALGMIPLAVSNAATGMAARVIPRQIASAVPGRVAGFTSQSVGGAPAKAAQWAAGLQGKGVIPWAVREGAQAAGKAASTYLEPWARYAPAIRDALMNLFSQQQGETPKP